MDPLVNQAVETNNIDQIQEKGRIITERGNISIEQYLEKVAEFSGDDYGQVVRSQFRGASELAMLAAPTPGELVELRRGVAIMTSAEKDNAETLTDEQIHKIAEDAKIDPANFAIFINGYAIHRKRPG